MATNREYTGDFQHNVKVSLKAENIARELIEQLTLDNLVSVRNEPEFYHIGDLLNQSGEGYDVKDDGVIHGTGNVFCEVRKRWKKSGQITDGWMMNGEYTYLVVLDQIDKNIYILDFARLKKIYRSEGFWRYHVDMTDNYTDGICVSLYKCKKFGALLHEAHYKYNDAWDCYEIDKWDSYNIA